jgi:hypothetical protein
MLRFRNAVACTALALAGLVLPNPEAGAAVESQVVVGYSGLGSDAPIGRVAAPDGAPLILAQRSTECVGGYRIIGRVEGRGKVTGGVIVRC